MGAGGPGAPIGTVPPPPDPAGLFAPPDEPGRPDGGTPAAVWAQGPVEGDEDRVVVVVVVGQAPLPPLGLDAVSPGPTVPARAVEPPGRDSRSTMSITWSGVGSGGMVKAT